MPSTVYFGSAHQARLEESETLTGKLGLSLRERVKDEFVIIKMHVGYKIGYATIYPVFLRKVVQAVKGGGMPFIVDVDWNVHSAATRGSTPEVLTQKAHSFQQLHGPLKDPFALLVYSEREGLGSRQYELVDVLPVEDMRPAPIGYLPGDGVTAQIS